jgi:hypothetical protein
MRTRVTLTLVISTAAAAVLAAQAPARPAPAAPRDVKATAPAAPALLPLPPIDQRPEALLQAQQLALAAYPELRQLGMQLRVEDAVSGPVVTFAEASHDSDDIVTLGRPRPAALVVETTIDATDTLTGAVLHGALARSADRRRIRALAFGWTQALDNEGAAFAPSRQAAFVQQLDLERLTPFAGTLTAGRTQFQRGVDDNGLYWEVAATNAAGEVVTLGFEPFGGRLVRFVKGGAQ